MVDDVFRVGHFRDPLGFVPVDRSRWQNRFDDPRREYRVLYAAYDPRTALREVLADLRPDTSAIAAYVSGGVAARSLDVPHGVVDWFFRADRALARGSLKLSGDLVDLEDITVRAELEARHATLLAERGVSNLDLPELRGGDRVVTQAISRSLFDRGAAGVLYRSRRDDGHCVALFEGRVSVTAIGDPQSLAGDHPTLASVAEEWSLVLKPAPLDMTLYIDPLARAHLEKSSTGRGVEITESYRQSHILTCEICKSPIPPESTVITTPVLLVDEAHARSKIRYAHLTCSPPIIIPTDLSDDEAWNKNEQAYVRLALRETSAVRPMVILEHRDRLDELLIFRLFGMREVGDYLTFDERVEGWALLDTPEGVFLRSPADAFILLGQRGAPQAWLPDFRRTGAALVLFTAGLGVQRTAIEVDFQRLSHLCAVGDVIGGIVSRVEAADAPPGWREHRASIGGPKEP